MGECNLCGEARGRGAAGELEGCMFVSWSLGPGPQCNLCGEARGRGARRLSAGPLGQVPTCVASLSSIDQDSHTAGLPAELNS